MILALDHLVQELGVALQLFQLHLASHELLQFFLLLHLPDKVGELLLILVTFPFVGKELAHPLLLCAPVSLGGICGLALVEFTMVCVGRIRETFPEELLAVLDVGERFVVLPPFQLRQLGLLCVDLQWSVRTAPR